MKPIFKNSLFILLVLASVQGLAQPYKSLFGNKHTEWTVMVIETYHDPIVNGAINWEDIKLTYQKDTLVQNKLYKKIVVGDSFTKAYHNMFRSFLVREDTITGKVWYNEYAINGCGHYDTTEHLMFDFNLQVGDTFNLESPICLPVNTYAKTVDSVYYDNNNLKHIRFQVGQITAIGGVIVEFIEGSGSTLGIFYKATCDYVPWPYMLCQWKDGIKTYTNSAFHGNCDPENNLHLSVTAPLKNKWISIYPNPAQNELTVDATSDGPCQLAITDISGKEVYKQQINNELTIPITYWARGLYFAQISDNKGQKHMEKIVLN